MHNRDRSEDESVRLLVEEAYSLALRGRPDEAWSLLDGRGMTSSGQPSNLRLCRSRIALSMAGANLQGKARAELEHIASEGTEDSWRAALDLARLATAEGRPADAAHLLERAVATFPWNRDEGPGSVRASLAGLLSIEERAALTEPENRLGAVSDIAWPRQSLARRRSSRSGSATERRTAYGDLVGASHAMQEIYRKLDFTVPTEMPVLVMGETGTGKELVARLIHARGPRAGRPFVATNCAGIAESLLEAELFGHERGAFTGADRSRPGVFEMAHGGTLFLDEIGDMSLRMQADLLRVLQSGEVRRVGGGRPFHVDVRVIAATHRDLEAMQLRGEFRQDLYYRLAVLTLELPALRERRDDVQLLVREKTARFVSEVRQPPRISPSAMARLVAYDWPGNVRELENIVRRLIVLGVETIEERHLPREVLRPGPIAARAGSLRSAEDEAVLRALRAARGNKAEAARILGVDRKTIYAMLRRGGVKSRLDSVPDPNRNEM